MTDLILWRHGQTDYNSQGRIQGQVDVPLNETGRDQARRAAEDIAALGPTRIVSSPLIRARDTAEALASLTGLSVEIDEGLAEKSFGDWEGLKAINPDVVGWLYVPGTTIDYPVYQSTDNEHYLRHSATGDWLVSGQVFMDYQNTAPGMVDQQSIIYGHHMLDGTMFEQIAAMDSQDTFDDINTIWYVTEQGATELEPLLLYYTRADNQNVRQFSFDSPDAFHAYLQGLLGEAVTKSADASQVIAGTSHVLSLVTCNYYRDYYMEDGTNGRTVLVCVPKAEDAAARAASGGQQ